MALLGCSVLAFLGLPLFLYILLIIYGMFDIVNAVGCCTMKMFSLSLCFAVHFPVAPCCLRNRHFVG